MMEQGIYRARSLQAALTMTSTEKEQVSVEVYNVETGETIWWNGFFTDAALEYTIKNLRAMGWKGDDITDLSSLKNSETEFEIVVVHETYQDKTRAKVKYINALDGSGGARIKPLDPNAARSFAARLKAKVRAIDAASGTAPARNSAPRRNDGPRDPEPPPHWDDDIPF